MDINEQDFGIYRAWDTLVIIHIFFLLLSDLRVERSFEAMLPPWITSMLRHLLVLGGVRRIQAPAGWRRSRSGGDHAGRRATGARVRQELGAVRGCSTHLGEEKHNSRDVKQIIKTTV